MIYFALGALILLPSCSQDQPSQAELRDDANRIYFRSYLPSVTTSRAAVVDNDNFTQCQVTCFNPDDPTLIDQSTNALKPYFTDRSFTRQADGNFLADGNDLYWPNVDSKLHFLAYSPSVAGMKETCGDDCFNLINSSRVLPDGTTAFDYRIEQFTVAHEIADQVDFVTAHAVTSLGENGSPGVALNFIHRLARVEISAWGANEKYDFEIAGVRIGNPLIQGDFNLSGALTSTAGTSLWENTGKQGVVEHIFSTGEKIVTVGKGRHATEATAVSVMGETGPAMVIPMTSRIEAWEGKNDPAITDTDYTTDRMYFSILVRVLNRDGEVAYPYHNDRDGMEVIYLAIDRSGKITSRLYNINGRYFTTPEPTEDDQEYIPGDSEKICGFGWASLPVGARWDAGKIYTYRLNYSAGIGWHDPSDPHPGEPIIERGHIPFDVTVNDWIPAEDYDSDINVPKR